MLGWTVHGDGKTIEPGAVVAPHERLSWGRTVGLGAQHVVAMFGATFVFPLLMGINPQLAIMMSGVATIVFLLMVKGRVPSYLGSSASFVGIAAAIRAQGGDSSTVTGALLCAGLALLLVGVVVHLAGPRMIHAVLPPVVTGAVVMLIGFNLAPVVARTYWPQDQWVALMVMIFAIVCGVALRGFMGRISIFASLVFGYVLSFLLDRVLGPITSATAAGKLTTHDRVDLTAVQQASWFGFPPHTAIEAGKEVVGWHTPSFSMAAIVLVLPAVIALIAENTGHVKAVGEMTGAELNPYLGRAIMADGIGSVISTSVGGPATTTYAENIGVMAATRVYSTAAYYVAAVVAILMGFSPKFGALISATPGGVLGGITVVLYGMIGLLGAKIWKENGVDFANPLNLVPVAAGVVIGIGDVSMKLGDNFSLGGIAFGTIITVVAYHLVRRLAPAHLLDDEGTVLTYGRSGSDLNDATADQA